MASAYSLHIGINKVDPDHYQGWDGVLRGCENDAMYYYVLAKSTGFAQSSLLLSSAVDPLFYPTSENLNRLLTDYSKALQPGDFLFISYSGHGGVVPDKNYDEDDSQDETWCLFDRQFIDDELWLHFSRFKKGVQIFLVSDSCHSGSVAKVIDDEKLKPENKHAAKSNFAIREAPKNITIKTYLEHRDIYLEFAKGPVIDKAGDVAATVLQFGACQDNETAAELDGFGLFTTTFKKVLEAAPLHASYQQLFDQIKTAMPPEQHPALFTYGSDAELFLKEPLFGYKEIDKPASENG